MALKRLGLVEGEFQGWYSAVKVRLGVGLGLVEGFCLEARGT